nr:MAG TPA: hypothetical protein [Caudoviricetes sp.]DAW41210.1 MAG TPA: hypothetical protein [Caudoviricetes sp.]
MLWGCHLLRTPRTAKGILRSRRRKSRRMMNSSTAASKR